MRLAPTTRTRWIIRLSLVGLLLILITAMVLAWPESSSIPPDEARARYPLLQTGWTRTEVESLLGKPSVITPLSSTTNLQWTFSQESLTESVVAQIDVSLDADEKVTSKFYLRFTFNGWPAWQWRWAKWMSWLRPNHGNFPK